MRTLLFVMFLFAGSSASSNTIVCNDRILGMVLNNFSTRAVAESWFPKTVKITDTTVQWGEGNGRWYRVMKNTGQDHLNAKIADPHVYKFKYNKNTERLSVQLVADAGYRTSLLYYNDCSYTSGVTQHKRSTTSNEIASHFKKMSICDRKYVQQFLKGQGVYSGAIDGIWGNGTANGLKSVKRTGKLRGLSDLKILKRLENNPLCD